MKGRGSRDPLREPLRGTAAVSQILNEDWMMTEQEWKSQVKFRGALFLFEREGGPL